MRLEKHIMAHKSVKACQFCGKATELDGADMYRNAENFTKVTLQNKYGSYTIEVPNSDLTIDTMMSQIIAPLLKAATYPSQLVNQYINSDIK